MFKDLHELAQSATLMMIIGADGDQLRVSVTPTQVGDKTKAHVLRPLSLVGTPEELDADFATALAVWQAPKMSLIEQAKAAASDDAAPASAAPGKPAAGSKGPKASSKKKPSSGEKPAEGALEGGNEEAAENAEFAAGPATDQPGETQEPASPEAVALVTPIEPAASSDTHTLDLF